MSEPLSYLRGRLLPASQASLALDDSGFVMGATVTDLCRTFRHELYRWDDHLARFRNSCQAAELAPPVTDAELTRIAQELVAHNAGLLKPEEDLALLVFITPGPIGYYSGLSTGLGDASPTFGMQTFPLPFARYRRLFQDGAHVAVPSTRQLPGTCIDPRIKHRSRLHWWLADREVHNLHPGAAAVLLDADGHLTETASANLLLVKHGTVLSPPRSTILAGVSLLAVEELCRENGFAFEERPLTTLDTRTADEILLTSTPYCLCGVSRFEGKAVPWPGAMLQLLLKAWSGSIGVDIQGQILKAV
jgi:branched-chain amino acid aminotransferase